ncbi:hypothetical protein SAMN05216282_108102 [Cryobacterium psychrotolerans]|uniref:Uncharacterized protein n=1 Tax=Cryobacterium psychrotolerans TaxID=386301 RepID=A0A1G9D7E4_9MICO|nr:hypothetical protein SAMN05216282_108102 [Cryobacterium psychrotolerans]
MPILGSLVERPSPTPVTMDIDEPRSEPETFSVNDVLWPMLADDPPQRLVKRCPYTGGEDSVAAEEDPRIVGNSAAGHQVCRVDQRQGEISLTSRFSRG